jgi:hypothetical protein
VLTWNLKVKLVLMRLSLYSRIGQEKSHSTQCLSGFSEAQRVDPLADAREPLGVPLLELHPAYMHTTLLEHLQE